MLSYQVGDIIELSTDSLTLYQVDEKGIKMIVRGLEYLERWDAKARKAFYKDRAEGWLNSGDRHSEEVKDKMYNELMENSNSSVEEYVTIEQLEETLTKLRIAYGVEPDDPNPPGRIAVENRWKFYVDKLMNHQGIWWLQAREPQEYPKHYGIAWWRREMDDLGVDYWAWDRYQE